MCRHFSQTGIIGNHGVCKGSVRRNQSPRRPRHSPLAREQRGHDSSQHRQGGHCPTGPLQVLFQLCLPAPGFGVLSVACDLRGHSQRTGRARGALEACALKPANGTCGKCPAPLPGAETNSGISYPTIFLGSLKSWQNIHNKM